MAAKYPLSGDFKNIGYEKPCFLRGIRARISSIKKKKVYWISAERNSSLKSEIHIHYFKKRGLFDGTLICVCLISQKTIQYVTYLKILDSLAPYAKMIDGAKNIHDFEINR